MKTTIVTRLLAVFAAASLAACAGSSSAYKARPAKPSTFTVGVREFTTPTYARQSAAEQGVRNYEHLALPAMLVRSLNGTPGVAGAYFVPASSPGVDLTVDGTIVASNGRDLNLELTIRRSDGKVLGTKKVAMTHRASDVGGIAAENEALFRQAAAAVVATGQGFRCDADELRALVYADRKGTPATPELVRMGNEAADVERRQIFAPLSSALAPRIAVTSGAYHQWQKEAVPFVNARQQAQAAKNAADAEEALGTLLSFAGGFAGGYAASQGNTTAMLSGMQIASSGAQIAAQASADSAVAQNKINELSAVLAKNAATLGLGKGQVMTVRIYNKVYTLKGSKEEMTAEFRRIVKEKMAEELAKSAPVAKV